MPRPRKCRGRREGRVPAGTRGPLYDDALRRAAQRHTGEAKHPAFPAQWFDGLCRALPGERCTIAPVALRMADVFARLGNTRHRKTWRTDPGRQDHTISPYAGCTGRVRGTIAHGVTRPATTIAPTPPASTTSHPACRDDRDSAPRPGWDGLIYDNQKFEERELFLRVVVDLPVGCFARRAAPQVVAYVAGMSAAIRGGRFGHRQSRMSLRSSGLWH
jgi:hypothetical protein